jgi:hypothetical protein
MSAHLGHVVTLLDHVADAASTLGLDLMSLAERGKLDAADLTKAALVAERALQEVDAMTDSLPVVPLPYQSLRSAQAMRRRRPSPNGKR